MSIPWQRYADDHVRTVDTMTASGSAAHLARTRPEHARKTLTDLTCTRTSAPREMKATVGVLRRKDEDHLTIALTDDDGSSAVVATPAPGHRSGLIGMPERARSVGGALQVRHRLEDGFEVATRLPPHSAVPSRDELPGTRERQP